MGFFSKIKQLFQPAKIDCFLPDATSELEIEIVVKLKEDLLESENKNETISGWWDRAHDANHQFWLSGSPGLEHWAYMEVLPRLSPGAKVLNIGVGLGYCTRALHERGCQVSALDISPLALERVKDIATPYLPGQLEAMPQNYYEVVISHLVAQHMNDADLLHQFKGVFKAMRADGVFAIQFVSSNEEDFDYAAHQSSSSQKTGAVFRTREQMAFLVNEAGGEVVKLWPGPVFPQYKSC